MHFLPDRGAWLERTQDRMKSFPLATSNPDQQQFLLLGSLYLLQQKQETIVNSAVVVSALISSLGGYSVGFLAIFVDFFADFFLFVRFFNKVGLFVGSLVSLFVLGAMVGEPSGRAGQNTGHALDISALTFCCCCCFGKKHVPR